MTDTDNLLAAVERTNELLEMLLILSLRRIDIDYARAVDLDAAQMAEIIKEHEAGRVVTDMPYMSQT